MNQLHTTLPGQVVIEEDIDALVGRLADAFAYIVREAVVKRERVDVALSGGSTPEPFFIRLVTDPAYRDLPWQRMHIWLVDERRVPLDHEKSNFRFICETLANHVPLVEESVHPVPTELADPAAAYEQDLREELGDTANYPKLDFILLGMGEDAHTASLFPHSPALAEQSAWVANNEGEHVTPPARITLTYPIINAAHNIAVLVTGQKKRETMRKVSHCIAMVGQDVQALPITGIKPVSGCLTWYLDQAAAGE